MKFKVSFKGKTHGFELSADSTLGDLRARIEELTGVASELQKIAGLVAAGQPAPSDPNTPLRSLPRVAAAASMPCKLMLFGMPQAELDAARAAEAAARAETEAYRARIAELEADERRVEEAARQHQAAIDAREAAELRQRAAEASERSAAIAGSFDVAGLWGMTQPVRHRTTFRDVQRRYEADMDAQLRSEDSGGGDGTATLAVELRAVPYASSSSSSSSAAIAASFEAGDRVVLPPSVLQQIVDRRIEFPVAFRLQKHAEEAQDEEAAAAASGDSSPIMTHAGVLEFSAAEGSCVVPLWMMRKLRLAEGDTLRIELVKDLPKGTSATMRPVPQRDGGDAASAACWVQLSEIRPLLEYHLRRWQSLSVGDTVPVPSGNEERPVKCELEVVKLSDQQGDALAVSITDVDLALELLPPGEDALKAAFLPGQEKVGTLSADEYEYSVLLVRDLPRDSFLRIRVEPTKPSGDPDLYVSCSTERPCAAHFGWASQEIGRSEVSIPWADEKLLGNNAVFIGVHAYRAPTGFRLSAEIVQQKDDGAAAAAPSGHRLDDGAAAAVPTSKCPHCGRDVPEISLQIHELRCARSLLQCSACKAVLSPQARPKHDELVHSKYKCECGAEYEQESLQVHRRFECPQRQESCRYCAASMRACDLPPHRAVCGARSTLCSHCGASLKRNELPRHLLEVHGISSFIPERDTK